MTQLALLRPQQRQLESPKARGGYASWVTPAALVANGPTPESIAREYIVAPVNTAPATTIYQAVKAWNQQHPEATFAITQSLLERDFRVPRRFVTNFLSQYQAALDAYHNAIGDTNTRSHNRQLGREVETLKTFVKQQAEP